jgi:hypothetical protein
VDSGERASLARGSWGTWQAVVANARGEVGGSARWFLSTAPHVVEESGWNPS